jgi:predicted dehydrogenase
MATIPTTDPSRKVKIGVVGLGFMGVTHLRAYLPLPNAQITAVCDSVRLPVNGVLQGVAGNVKKSDDVHLGPGVKVYRNLEDVLADPDVELVDLCTPTPFHPDQAIAALKANKFVFCEKPIARTSAQAREILKAAEASKGFLMPAMCMRFWPGWSSLKQIVEQQPYGKILTARFRRLSEMPFWSKQGTYSGSGSVDLGGALFDLHIHDTDFVQFLFGRPSGVFSTGVVSGSGSIDHVTTQYLYPGGPAVYAEGSWLLAKGFHMSYTLHCERATLDFDLARGDDAMVISEQGKEPRTVPCEGPDGYSHEVAYIVDCVLNRRAPEVVTARDGMTALEICEAEEKSVRTGTVVSL